MIVSQIVYAGCVVGGCLIAYPYGLVAVAIAVSIAGAISYTIVNFNACRLARVGLTTFLRAHAHGALLALACTIVTAPEALGLRAAGALAVVVLATTGAAIAALGVLLGWLRPRWLLGDLVVQLLEDAGRGLARRRVRAEGKVR